VGARRQERARVKLRREQQKNARARSRRPLVEYLPLGLDHPESTDWQRTWDDLRQEVGLKPSSRFARLPLQQAWCDAQRLRSLLRDTYWCESLQRMVAAWHPTPEQEMADLLDEHEGGAVCGLLFPARREYLQRRMTWLDAQMSGEPWQGAVPRWWVEFREVVPLLDAPSFDHARSDPDLADALAYTFGVSPAESIRREHEARMAEMGPVLERLHQRTTSPIVDRVQFLLDRYNRRK
jgi:hypothetical protein